MVKKEIDKGRSEPLYLSESCNKSFLDVLNKNGITNDALDKYIKYIDIVNNTHTFADTDADADADESEEQTVEYENQSNSLLGVLEDKIQQLMREKEQLKVINETEINRHKSFVKKMKKLLDHERSEHQKQITLVKKKLKNYERKKIPLRHKSKRIKNQTKKLERE